MKQKVTICLIAQPAPAAEATIYRRLRDLLIKTHCSAERAHKCCGAITITRDCVLFQCPACGDFKQTIVSDRKSRA